MTKREQAQWAEQDWRVIKAQRVESAVAGDVAGWAHVMEARVDVDGVPWPEVARWTSSIAWR